MLKKELKFDVDARLSLFKGIEKLYKAVSGTLGPRGRFVVNEAVYGIPHTTKDGATVAKNVFLEDHFEQMGVEMVREAATRTCDQAGDGTTTSIVLAYFFIESALDMIRQYGVTPYLIARTYEKLGKQTLQNLLEQSQSCDVKSPHLKNVAYVASNGDEELSQAVIDVFNKAGEKANIAIQLHHDSQTIAEITHGFTFEGGYASPYFLTHPAKKTAILENPYVLIYPGKIPTLHEMKVLEEVQKTGRPLLMIVGNIEGEPLGMLVRNHMQQRLKVCVVKVPFSEEDTADDMMKDIALLTGAKILNSDLGKRMSDITLKYLGECARAVIKENETLIVEGTGDEKALEDRIDELLELAEVARGKYKDVLDKRASMLRGTIGLLKVGGMTEQEALERKDRAEDCVNAVRSALQEGISMGGGVALAMESFKNRLDSPIELATPPMLNELPEEQRLSLIVKAFQGLPHHAQEAVVKDVFCRVLLTPLRKILENCAVPMHEMDALVDHLHRSDNPEIAYRIDETGEIIQSATPSVYDPTKVIRCALENALSVANLFIQTTCSIVLKDDPEHLQRAIQQTMRF